jgi:hypothetical protein
MKGRDHLRGQDIDKDNIKLDVKENSRIWNQLILDMGPVVGCRDSEQPEI